MEGDNRFISLTKFNLMKLVSVLSLAFLASATQAQTQTSPADTARSWGLVGRWAGDCSTGKPVAFEIEPDGRLIYDNAVGNIAGIDTATITPEGKIVLVYFWPVDRTTRTLVLDKNDGRIRAILSRSADNKYSIRNGVAVSTGTETSWMWRCN